MPCRVNSVELHWIVVGKKNPNNKPPSVKQKLNLKALRLYWYYSIKEDIVIFTLHTLQIKLCLFFFFSKYKNLFPWEENWVKSCSLFGYCIGSTVPQKTATSVRGGGTAQGKVEEQEGYRSSFRYHILLKGFEFSIVSWLITPSLEVKKKKKSYFKNQFV